MISLILIFLNSIFLNAQDLYIKAMEDELERNIKNIKMEDFKPPYFIAYTNYDNDYCRIISIFGSTVSIVDNRDNLVKVEVRVGDRSFDNTNYTFDLRNYYPKYTFLPLEEDYDLSRNRIWFLTDEAYKEAVEVYSKKEAYRKKKELKELYKELADERSSVLIKEVKRNQKNCKDYIPFVNKISSIYRKYPEIKSSSIEFNYYSKIKRYVNSEKTKFLYSTDYYEIIINNEMIDKNGYLKSDNKSFIVKNKNELNGELLKRIEQYVSEFSKSYNSSEVDYYLGPAIFEEEAVANLFNELLVRNISFYPPVESDNEKLIEYYYSVPKLVDRIGKRITAGFINVYDDPLAINYKGIGLVGGYEIDDEGVYARKISIVENGVLKNIYSTRRLNKYSNKSSGNARGTAFMYNYPFSSNVFIESSKKTSYNKIIEEAKKIARDQKINEILVVRYVKKFFSDEMFQPLIAYLLDIRTGEKKYLTNVKFDGMGLRTLRDIIYTEDKEFVYNFNQMGPFYYSDTVPSSMVVPRSILISELEVVKSNLKPDKKPYISHPYFGKR